MQRLLARPVAAPLLFFFGFVNSQIGYTYLSRGSFLFRPRGEPAQIISPTTNPTYYWGTTAGLLTVGAVCFVFSVYAAHCFYRAYRAQGAHQFRPRPFGIVMFSLGLFVMIIALVTGTCAHH